MQLLADDSCLARDNVVECEQFEWVRNVQTSRSTEERCTAVHFGSVSVIGVCAPDSAKDFEEYEKFMRGATKVMLEGRKKEARRFFVPGDLNIE